MGVLAGAPWHCALEPALEVLLLKEDCGLRVVAGRPGGSELRVCGDNEALVLAGVLEGCELLVT